MVNVSGGSVGDSFFALSGSEVNISGGTFGSEFNAFFNTNISLFGSDFALDGVLLEDSLVVDQAFVILDRDVVLSGILADGSEFSFDLNQDFVFGSDEDFFSSDATLAVTLISAVPEPGSLTLFGWAATIFLCRRRKTFA